MIVVAGLTPAWQQILTFERFEVGEVNRATETYWCASGKVLNVAIALHHLGAESTAVSLIGGDSGKAIQRELARLKIGTRWVTSRNPTRICTTILDRKNGTTTELVQNAASVEPDELDAFLAAFNDEVPSAEFVILIGSLPRGTPPSFCRDLLSHTRARAILDIRGEELLQALDRKPFLVKPNRAELAQTMGSALDTDDALLAAMSELNQRGAEWVLVTDGPNPLYLASASAAYRLKPPPSAVLNPIGCGDCLAAGIACVLQQGLDVVEAVRFGAAAAADNARQILPSRLDPNRIKDESACVVCEPI